MKVISMMGAVLYLFLAFVLLWWGTDFLSQAMSPQSLMRPEACLWGAILLFAFAISFLWGAIRLLSEGECQRTKQGGSKR